MMPRTCPECSNELQQQRLASITGEDMGWRVRALEYPVFACPRGHVLRELYPDFNTSWSTELSKVPSLWVTAPSFFRRKWRCPSCGEKQQHANTEQASRKITLHNDKEGQFSVEIAGPMRVCRRCGQGFIGKRAAGQVFEALAKALKSHKIERWR